MFGLIYAAFASISDLIWNIQKNNNNSRKRQDAIKSHRDYYIDFNGAKRDVKTDKCIFERNADGNPWGDHLIVNEDGKVLRNISKEQRDKNNDINRRLAILNGNTVYELGRDEDRIKNISHPDDIIYVDLNSNEQYILVYLNETKEVELPQITIKEFKEKSKYFDSYTKNYFNLLGYKDDDLLPDQPKYETKSETVWYYARISDGKLIRKADFYIINNKENYSTNLNEAAIEFNKKDKDERIYRINSQKRNRLVDKSVPNKKWLFCDHYKYDGVPISIKKYMTQDPTLYI